MSKTKAQKLAKYKEDVALYTVHHLIQLIAEANSVDEIVGASRELRRWLPLLTTAPR